MRAIAFHVSSRPICTRPISIFLVGIQLHLTYDIVSRKLISLALACFNHLHLVSALQNSIDKVRFQLQLKLPPCQRIHSPLSTLTGLTRPGFPNPPLHLNPLY